MRRDCCRSDARAHEKNCCRRRFSKKPTRLVVSASESVAGTFCTLSFLSTYEPSTALKSM
jgi:hypothetical protein